MSTDDRRPEPARFHIVRTEHGQSYLAFEVVGPIEPVATGVMAFVTCRRDGSRAGRLSYGNRLYSEAEARAVTLGRPLTIYRARPDAFDAPMGELPPEG